MVFTRYAASAAKLTTASFLTASRTALRYFSGAGASMTEHMLHIMQGDLPFFPQREAAGGSPFYVLSAARSGRDAGRRLAFME